MSEHDDDPPEVHAELRRQLDAAYEQDRARRGIEAFRQLMDSYAVQTEHRDVTRMQLFRETLEHVRDTGNEREVEWALQALEALDRTEPD